MSVGVIMLVHDALDRAEQIARHWVKNGCPVVIHADKRVPSQVYGDFKAALSDLPELVFCKRHKCEWGTFSLVQATQSAAELMLATFADVRHVYLASGSCLPLRPVSELLEYLEQRPRTDFIESVATEYVLWTIGGLDHERFTLRFPFAWKRNRTLFDAYVSFQRRLGFKRKIPPGIVPHLGSQWWCLTRQTLSAILEDPERGIYDRYFSRVWIPDESYFQTLARHYSTEIESRSLTLSKFDFQGKPHIFYDDHLQLLRRSDCFVARKIWPYADRLYEAFLSDEGRAKLGPTEPNPGKIDRVFAKAVERRTKGRPGLYMQSRYPREGYENGKTCSPYSVFQGFSDVFEDFDSWLAKTIGVQVHGHLFAPERAEFAGGEKVFAGALSDSAKLRDYNARNFLTSLIWNARGQRQCFQFGPRDNQEISWLIATDPNAHISVVTGAWAVPLFQSNKNFSEIRKEAARLQAIEGEHLKILRSIYTKAKVRIWTLADFIDAPMEPLQIILDELGPKSVSPVTEVPRMTDLRGFGRFLQNLRNQGMDPHLVGDFSMDLEETTGMRVQRPYIVQ